MPVELRERVIRRMSSTRWPDLDRPRRAATPAELAASERELEFPLPPAVVDFYTSVANGGGGFLGLLNGATDDLGNNAITLYAMFMNPPEPEPDPEYTPTQWRWFEAVVPIYYWGCNTYSCVDRTGRMVGRDSFAWVSDGRTFEEWLSEWADGVLQQPSNRP